MIARVLDKLAFVLRSPMSRPVVLMYHRVADEVCDPWELAVSPENFDSQLAMLKREREVLPLAEFAALLARGKLPSRATAITFDDGYACNAHTAALILQRYRLPATFFVTTGAIGSHREYWWDELLTLVVETQISCRETIQLGERSIQVDFNTSSVSLEVLKKWRQQVPPIHTRLILYMEIWRLMRPLPHYEQRTIVDLLWRACGRSPAPRETHRLMTLGEVHTLSNEELFAIQPHTVTHPALSTCSEAIQMQEIIASRDWCTTETGCVPTMFAYPYGDLTGWTAKLVQEAGFSLACSTKEEAIHPGCNPFSVPRLQVLNRSGAWLGNKLDELSSSTG